MKKTLGIYLGIIASVILSAAIISLPTLAWGEGGYSEGVEIARGTGVPTNLADGDGSLVKRIINTLLLAIAVVSVVMLIIGGFRYVISGGQKESVTAAKNTILYAIVGLLIAIFAYAIVKFVIDIALSGGGATDV